MLQRNSLVALGRRGYVYFRANTLMKRYSSNINKPKVVVADDGRTLVCWHPEPDFPYEHSLPLPEEKEEATSVLKSVNKVGITNVSHLEGMKEELARQELMKLTHTTKHRWFPHVQKKKAKKTEMDRPYL